MKSKKSVIILVVIALILAIAAVSLRLTDSNEVPIAGEEDHKTPIGTGNVGLTVLPSIVEDKLADNSGGNQE